MSQPPARPGSVSPYETPSDISDPRALSARTDLAAITGRLFAPGERLGWVFRDRREASRPFGEPAPVRAAAPQRTSGGGSGVGEMARWLGLSVALGVLLVGLAWTASWFDETFESDQASTASTVLIWCLALPLLVAVYSIFRIVRAGTNSVSARKGGGPLERRHRRELAEWQRRKAEHEQAEMARASQEAEWMAASTPSGTRRLDVFGGTLWGWEALITTHGASTLTSRPLIVLDFSREVVCEELAQLASAAGFPVHAQLLPEQLRASDLASGLPTRNLIDALIEAMYGDNPETMRAERSLDDRILSKLCEALGTQVTIARLAAALAVLMGETASAGVLTGDETVRIRDEVFTEDYIQQNHAAIARMEAFLHPVRDLGTDPAPYVNAQLRCVALGSAGGRSVRGELLTDLIIQYLTYQLAQAGADAPAVLVAGADELARRHVERLSDVCERRNVPLTLLFRHLREQSLDLVGGGAVAFMRLGNHHEATAAADFIGRGHKFLVSQVTKTLGGDETHTATDGKGGAVGNTGGKSTQWAPLGPFPEGSSTHRSRTKSRNWSTAKAFAEGTNWTNAESRQRVYEYTVEPTTLQQLPDHALLLTETTARQGTRLTSVECDPAIATLPRVAFQPVNDQARIGNDPSWDPIGGGFTAVEQPPRKPAAP